MAPGAAPFTSTRRGGTVYGERTNPGSEGTDAATRALSLTGMISRGATTVGGAGVGRTDAAGLGGPTNWGLLANMGAFGDKAKVPVGESPGVAGSVTAGLCGEFEIKAINPSCRIMRHASRGGSEQEEMTHAAAILVSAASEDAGRLKAFMII